MTARMQNKQPPAFFTRGPSPLTRLLVFGLLSFALMFADARLHYLNEVRTGLAAMVQPLEVIATIPSAIYGGISKFLVSQSSQQVEIAQMRKQILTQGADVQRLNSLVQENDHLRKLFGAAQNLTQTSILAEISHVGRDPFSRKVIVNVGSTQGVVAGQAAVDAEGVVGQITRVYPFSSELTLITDKQLAIPVQVERNSLRAIAFGNGGSNTLDLPYLPANVDIRVGDLLKTSGIDGVYPIGLAVAKVSSVVRNGEVAFARIVCIPAAEIGQHKQVLLLSAISVDARVDTSPLKPVTMRPKHATN